MANKKASSAFDMAERLASRFGQAGVKKGRKSGTGGIGFVESALKKFVKTAARRRRR